ncbi:MAG: FAD-dependent oxidoreductase, partial [Actinobacteria bacterium]|nr:FAD-dependent oxidoreductase [Actinomycetota bacterium]
MPEEREFDVIVLGGGSAGENAAWYAIDNGLSVAIVESELVGGECTYWACMPSKALLRPGEVLAAARRVPGAVPAVTGTVDVDATLSSRDSFAANWDDVHQANWVESIGAELVRGHGRLAGERTVEVEQDDGGIVTLTAGKAVVVATGSRAAIPPVDGLRDIEIWDNRDITSAKQVPARLLILGGGVVGVSMLYHLAKKGWSDVVLLERKELTSGSTWHAAGLLPLFNMSYSVGQIHKYSVRFYQELEEETGQNVGFRKVSNIRLALN